MAVVLVVEDDPNAGAVLEHQLSSAGHDVHLAATVEQAWESTVTHAPDVAIVDLMLSGVSGWTFIDRARADVRFSQLPVIVLTGSGRIDDERRANEFGYEFFAKPYSTSVLVDRVNRLGTARAARATSGIAAVTRLTPIGVVLLVGGYQIEGFVHMAPELQRFSDAWESLLRDRREFIPLTDARVRAADGAFSMKTSFIEVRKSDVSAAFPVEDAATPPNAP